MCSTSLFNQQCSYILLNLPLSLINMLNLPIFSLWILQTQIQNTIYLFLSTLKEPQTWLKTQQFCSLNLTLILAAWLQIWPPKHKTTMTGLLFIKKNWKKFVILQKRLVFNFVSVCFYQNDVLFDYSIKIQYLGLFGVLCRCIQCCM
jgi:hypothetical protein